MKTQLQLYHISAIRFHSNLDFKACTYFLIAKYKTYNLQKHEVWC